LRVGVQHLNPLAAQLGFVDGSRTSSGSKRKLFLGLGAVILLGLLLAGAGGLYLLTKKTVTETPIPAPPLAERSLSYGLTVQKMRNGKPYQDTFESSGQEIFENGWKFRMNIDSPQKGYLYLLNEGPGADDTTTYNMLFPAPSNNSGSPFVEAQQKIETGWMVFDQNQGTEDFWVVWSATEVPELEAVKGVVNPHDKGEVRDEGQKKAVKQFLDRHPSAEAVTQKDKAKKQSTVKASGDVLVHRLELEHH
jgi:hypothetical protein